MKFRSPFYCIQTSGTHHHSVFNALGHYSKIDTFLNSAKLGKFNIINVGDTKLTPDVMELTVWNDVGEYIDVVYIKIDQDKRQNIIITYYSTHDNRSIMDFIEGTV